MTTIYRIERPETGMGPYHVRGLCTLDDPDIHPTPECDPELDWDPTVRNPNLYFGFISLEQLCRWFYSPAHIREMDEAGMKLTIWHLPNHCYMRASQKQAVFERTEANLLEVRSLLPLAEANSQG